MSESRQVEVAHFVTKSPWRSPDLWHTRRVAPRNLGESDGATLAPRQLINQHLHSPSPPTTPGWKPASLQRTNSKKWQLPNRDGTLFDEPNDKEMLFLNPIRAPLATKTPFHQPHLNLHMFAHHQQRASVDLQGAKAHPVATRESGRSGRRYVIDWYLCSFIYIHIIRIYILICVRSRIIPRLGVDSHHISIVSSQVQQNHHAQWLFRGGSHAVRQQYLANSASGCVGWSSSLPRIK